MITLRPYQEQIITDLRHAFRTRREDGTSRRVMIYLPTGGGKTVIAAQMFANAVKKGRKGMFVVERTVLVEQARASFERIGVNVGVLQGDNTFRHPNEQVLVATIQTIRSRKERPPVDFIVIDEAHILHDEHIELLQKWSLVPAVGLSATPLRKDLGVHFDTLLRGPTVKQLTDENYLAPLVARCPSAEDVQKILEAVPVRMGDYSERHLGKAMNRKELIGDVISTWKKYGEDRQTLVFAVDRAHSRAIVDDFAVEGIAAAHMDYRTPQEDRAQLLQQFTDGDIRILSSVDLLGIGTDLPVASCAIMARPTRSEIRHFQYLGRLLRIHPGKENALLLDHTANSLDFGLPHHFECPEMDIGEHKKSDGKRRQVDVVPCSECGYLMESGQQTCPGCGIDRPVKSADVVNLNGDLVEWGAKGETKEDSAEEQQRWYRGFKWIVEGREQNPGRAAHLFKDKFGKYPPRYWSAFDAESPAPEITRFERSRCIAYRKALEKRQQAN